MASKLYIGGLAYSTTSEGLREFFTQCGNVLSATVITDRFSGQSRGFGFVEMNTAEEAQASISQLNGRELDGGGSRWRSRIRRPPARVVAEAATGRVAVVADRAGAGDPGAAAAGTAGTRIGRPSP